ncbi:MAG: fatty acid hydroxylase [Candidatus Pelagibacterales bacterium]|nr:MAG: fatty acid hydroxylase [Pelagibacterales bacterium]
MSVDFLFQYSALELFWLLVPILIGIAVVETLAIYFFKLKGKNDFKEWILNISMGVLSYPVNGIFAFITLGALFWAKEFQIYTFPFTLSALVLCFILDDLTFYLHHRICHRWRWGWGLHRTHHSSERMGIDVGARQPFTKHFTGTRMLKIPLVIIGFDPVMVLFCVFINGYYQYLCHTQTIYKLPRWYEYLFNTPSHHRVHHARNPKYLDANYAGTLMVWDRMFGTFVAEDPKEPCDYGLVVPMTSLNPLRILFEEYANIFKDISMRGISLKDRFMYLFGPPGWSHDGTRKTSTQIKEDYNRAIKSH